MNAQSRPAFDAPRGAAGPCARLFRLGSGRAIFAALLRLLAAMVLELIAQNRLLLSVERHEKQTALLLAPPLLASRHWFG
jgi:hypothetical protein